MDVFSRQVIGGSGAPDERGLMEVQMEKRLVTRYATKSTEAADENQRRIETVFAELEATKPENVSYIVLRLADGSFVHVSFHNHTDDEVNPIASTAAFAHFQDGHGSRREGGVDQQTATLVGAYVTVIE
jgi:predicted SnoaL-like aldol condensation-catalyzing enzyme